MIPAAVSAHTVAVVNNPNNVSDLIRTYFSRQENGVVYAGSSVITQDDKIYSLFRAKQFVELLDDEKFQEIIKDFEYALLSEDHYRIEGEYLFIREDTYNSTLSYDSFPKKELIGNEIKILDSDFRYVSKGMFGQIVYPTQMVVLPIEIQFPLEYRAYKLYSFIDNNLQALLRNLKSTRNIIENMSDKEDIKKEELKKVDDEIKQIKNKLEILAGTYPFSKMIKEKQIQFISEMKFKDSKELIIKSVNDHDAVVAVLTNLTDMGVEHGIEFFMKCKNINDLTLETPLMDAGKADYLFELERLRFQPMVAEGSVQCLKCKSWEVMSIPVQTRSADEPMTIRNKCHSCDKGWNN